MIQLWLQSNSVTCDKLPLDAARCGCNVIVKAFKKAILSQQYGCMFVPHTWVTIRTKMRLLPVCCHGNPLCDACWESIIVCHDTIFKVIYRRGISQSMMNIGRSPYPNSHSASWTKVKPHLCAYQIPSHTSYNIYKPFGHVTQVTLLYNYSILYDKHDTPTMKQPPNELYNVLHGAYNLQL